MSEEITKIGKMLFDQIKKHPEEFKIDTVMMESMDSIMFTSNVMRNFFEKRFGTPKNEEMENNAILDTTIFLGIDKSKFPKGYDIPVSIEFPIHSNMNEIKTMLVLLESSGMFVHIIPRSFAISSIRGSISGIYSIKLEIGHTKFGKFLDVLAQYYSLAIYT